MEQRARGEGLLLVDWDNCYPSLDASQACTAAAYDLPRVVSYITRGKSLGHISVRLYGGWREDGTLSRLGSKVQSMLSEVDPFPATVDGVLVHGSLELVQRLLCAPSVELGDTVRRRSRPPQVRLSSEHRNLCVFAHEDCPARMVCRFTKAGGSTCPHPRCELSSRQVFQVHEQKMIDTMLTCDLAYAVISGEFAYMGVITADTDFVPPLVFARQLAEIEVFDTPAHGWGSEYEEYLLNAGVNVTKLETLGNA